MSERYVRGALVVLLFFNAFTAIGGAIFVVPTMPVGLIVWGPFSDFTVPAIALGAVGVMSGLAALGVVATPALGAIAAVVAGLAMAIFEVVEVAVTGLAVLEHPDVFQAWLQPIFFMLGLVVAALALELYRLAAGRTRRVMRPV